MAIVITEQDITFASTYIPIEVKAALSQTIAGLVIENVNMVTDSGELLPPLWKEKRGTKELFLMGIFANAYLHKGFKCNTIPIRNSETNELTEEPCDYFMTSEAYNEYAESHVFNQIERLKRSHKDGIGDAIFDMLDDFYTFKNMVNGEIRDLLEEKNDVVGRMSEYVKYAVEGTVADLGNIKSVVDKKREELKNE